MPLGASFGAATLDGRLLITLRYRHTLLNAATADQLLTWFRGDTSVPTPHLAVGRRAARYMCHAERRAAGARAASAACSSPQTRTLRVAARSVHRCSGRSPKTGSCRARKQPRPRRHRHCRFVVKEPSSRRSTHTCVRCRTGILVGEFTGPAQREKRAENGSTDRVLDRPVASQTTGSCGGQSSSATAGGLAVGARTFGPRSGRSAASTGVVQRRQLPLDA